MKEKIIRIILKIIAIVLLGVLTVSTLLPYLMMVSTSLMAQFEVYKFPPKLIPTTPRWENYKEMWKSQPWGRYLFNTVFVASVVVFGQLLIISMGGYAPSRLRFLGRDTLFKIFIAFMMLPGVLPSYQVSSSFRV